MASMAYDYTVLMCCCVMVQKSQSAGPHSYTPSWVKYRYGAWYLQPKLWTKQPVDEPLRDPREHKNKEVSEAKSQSLRLVCTLADSQSGSVALVWLSNRLLHGL